MPQQRRGLRRWRPSTTMGCYYHPAVPTAVLCRECGHEICTHCAEDSLCPGCRLGQAMKGAAQRQPVLTAIKGGGNGAYSQPGPRPTFTASAQPAAPPRPTATVVDAPPAPEDRLLAALCYPLWPIAMI